MDKKKLVIVIISILVLIAIIITVVFIVKNNSSTNEPIVINPNVKVTGNLKDYIANMSENYYIKYSGKFKNNSGELVNAIVEYTKDGENYALRSSELDMHVICEKDKLYSISYRYKIMMVMGRQSLDISEYNLVSDINQIFINGYKEKVNNTEYDVEEYLFNSKVLKYYFKDSDIKLIRYDGQDIKVIRLEKNSNKEMLVKPEGYKFVMT